MTEELDLTLAFATGLLGALHCLGMCSGIAGAFFVRYGRDSLVLSVLLFHATRILIYTLLGVAGAALGRVLVQTGIIGKGQGILMMTAGVLIVVIGLALLGPFPRSRPQESCMQSAGAPIRFNGAASPDGRWLAVLAGALNGFVPCSLVFTVAIKAAATADPLRAGLLMAAFGLGTLPTMALVSVTGATVGRGARGLLARLAGLAVIALGLWTLYEGLVFFNIMRGLANW